MTALHGLATRALHAAGFTRLEQVAGVPECELAQLHGVGSKALRLLREALADRGLSFRLMPGPDSGGVDPVDVALRNETRSVAPRPRRRQAPP